jgi:ABC-2 type transport system permease protein
VACDDGHQTDLEVVMSAQSGAQAALQSVRASVQAVDTEQRQIAALQDAGVSRNEAVAALELARTTAQLPRLEIVDTDNVAQRFTGLGQFDLGAAQQLLLFVFLSSLTGAATLIQARRLGVISRMMSAPVTSWEAIAGQALGRFGIAVVQGAYIMVGTALLFGVDWGNPILAGLILAVFAAVAAAAAMVIGSIFDNDAVSSGVGWVWAWCWPAWEVRWCLRSSSLKLFKLFPAPRCTAGPTTPSPRSSGTTAGWPTSCLS